MASLWQRGSLALVIATVFLAMPKPARAQNAEVEAMIRRGLDLRRQGHDEQAFQVFESAWGSSRSPRARAQMALAAQALGRWADADRFMREALAATDDAWVNERRAVLGRSLSEIDARLGLLEVRCNVDGAALRVDGADRGAMPLREPLRLPAGTVTLQVSAPGYIEVIRQTVLSAGGTTREQINLVVVPPVVTPPVVAVRPPREGAGPIVPPPQEPPSGGALQRALAWTSGGVALVGLATGVGFLLARNAEASDFNARNEDGDPTNDCARGSTARSCVDSESAVSSRATLATVGFVVGGAAAVASAVLFATLPTRAERAHVTLRGCSLAPGRGGVALGCEITF